MINNIPLRKIRADTRRPITDSGLKLFSVWVTNQVWKDNKEAHDVNNKVKIINKMLMEIFHKFFPLKISKVSTYDSPWCNDKVNHLK